MSKFGIRALSQSLAREFGAKGVHVSHSIIDGIIDTEKTRAYSQDIPDSKIDPEWVSALASLEPTVLVLIIFHQIAESYWFLHTQPRTSFTHEIDLRPYSEKW